MTPAETTEALDGIAETLRMGANDETYLNQRMLWMLHAAVLECVQALNGIPLKVLDDPAR